MNTTWVYIKSEPTLWTVGFYAPDGKWNTDSDHTGQESAAKRCAWLNGALRSVCGAPLTTGGTCSAACTPFDFVRTMPPVATVRPSFGIGGRYGLCNDCGGETQGYSSTHCERCSLRHDVTYWRNKAKDVASLAMMAGAKLCAPVSEKDIVFAKEALEPAYYVMREIVEADQRRTAPTGLPQDSAAQ